MTLSHPFSILRVPGLCALVAGLCLWSAIGKCDPISSQAFASLGSITTNTGNIETANTFSIGQMGTTPDGTGYFSFSGTAAPQFMNNFGDVTFTVNQPTSLSFTNSDFGTFTSTSINEIANSTGTRTFLALGQFTGGLIGGLTTPSPTDAEFTMGFTQSPAATGSISFSGTLAIVPEPSTLVLAACGLVGLTIASVRRRARRLPAGLDAEVDAVQEDVAVVVEA